MAAGEAGSWLHVSPLVMLMLGALHTEGMAVMPWLQPLPVALREASHWCCYAEIMLGHLLHDDVQVSFWVWSPVSSQHLFLILQAIVQVLVDFCRLAGLEQTVESKPLPDFPFEERTVLVLGTESSGIPPQILQVKYDKNRPE